MSWKDLDRLKEMEGKVLTPDRLETYWLAQVGAYLAFSGPQGVHLVPGVDNRFN